MATITGLQSPNPYAQAPAKAVSRPAGQPSASGTSTYHPSYSPDWMQGDHAAAAPNGAAVYGPKGELHTLPSGNRAPVQSAPQETVSDEVTLSTPAFSVDYAVHPGTGQS